MAPPRPRRPRVPARDRRQPPRSFAASQKYRLILNLRRGAGRTRGSRRVCDRDTIGAAAWSRAPVPSSPMNPQCDQGSRDGPDEASPISPRELQVIALVVDGLTNREIGQRLGVSSRTVQAHVASAMEKAPARSRTALAVWSVRCGLVPLQPCPTGPAVPKHWGPQDGGER